jgi:hypothetical protein
MVITLRCSAVVLDESLKLNIVEHLLTLSVDLSVLLRRHRAYQPLRKSRSVESRRYTSLLKIRD